MSDQQSVDAGSQDAPASNPEQAPQTNEKGADYWQSEAHTAFEKRDKWKARAADYEAQLNELRTSKADANEELGNQLKAVMAERDELNTKLSATVAAHREAQILNKLSRNTPAEKREALGTLYRKFADQLDDGEAAPDEIAAKAEAMLSEFAPTLFSQPQPTAPQARGVIPGDGGQKGFDLDRGLKSNRDQFRKRFKGTTGVSL